MGLKFGFFSALALLVAKGLSQETFIVPPFVIPGDNSQTQYVSGADGFDFPKSRHITKTAYDWWYFDIVSEVDAMGGQTSMAATFHTTGPEGFDPLASAFPLGEPTPNIVYIELVWPDGETETLTLLAGEVTFILEGDGASADFSGTGCSFEGTPDLSRYTVHVNAPQKGVVGSMHIVSRVPAHYPCGPAVEGQDMHIAPGAGWVNAIPNGYGVADFLVRGRPFKFQGSGYHDHNYGSEAFSNAIAASYWGHGQLGDYSIVWADVLSQTDNEVRSAYVAKGSEIIAAQCGIIQVRPYGDNSTYPPTTSTGTPTGFNIEIALPEGQLELKAEYLHITVDLEFYHRFTGTFTGTLNGQPLPAGVALWEQFTLRD